MKEKCFIVFLVLCLIVFVFGGCKNNTETETTTEITTGSTTVVTTEETTEKKETVTTTEATAEKKATEDKTEKESEKTKAQTTEKVEVATTRKPVTTTKKPVETQVIRETTTKAPETTKKPTTTKAEYYPALTQADMEELKRYAINYIESKGYRADPDITWNNAGYYVTVGLRDDLSDYGDQFKVDGGTTPLEYAKQRMKGKIDWHIEDWERANGPDSIYGMYPLVRRSSTGWQWTIGYW